MEPLEAAAVAALLARGLDQLVEDRIGEAALVRPARRLEEQPKVVLRIGIARQPADDPDAAGVTALGCAMDQMDGALERDEADCALESLLP